MPPIAQYVFNGIVTGGILALPTVAFSLLWRLLRFPNFAVSTYLTVGAYAALALNAGARAPLEAAWLGALLATGGVALAVDRIAFRPMRDRRPFSLAIASIGVAFVLENVVRFVWGNDFRAYDVPVTRAGSVEETGTLIVPPTYKTAIGFVIILAVLLVRPSGLAGSRS